MLCLEDAPHGRPWQVLSSTALFVALAFVYSVRLACLRTCKSQSVCSYYDAEHAQWMGFINLRFFPILLGSFLWKETADCSETLWMRALKSRAKTIILLSMQLLLQYTTTTKRQHRKKTWSQKWWHIVLAKYTLLTFKIKITTNLRPTIVPAASCQAWSIQRQRVQKQREALMLVALWHHGTTWVRSAQLVVVSLL